MKKALVMILIFIFAMSLAVLAEKKKTQETQPVVTPEQLIAGGEYQKAIDLGNKMIASGQETAGLLFNIGLAHYKLKDYTNSLGFLEKAFAKAGDPAALDTKLQLQALLFEATIYHEINSEDKVAEVYARALAIAPEDKEVLYSYAHLLEAKDKAKAFEIYDKLVPIDPLYKNVGYDSGIFALQNSDLDRAEKYLTLAKQAKPDSEEILLALAKLYLTKKDFASAAPVLENAILVTTREILKPKLLLLLGDCQLETSKPMETIATCDKVLAIRTNDENALVLKTKAYRNMKDLKNAAATADSLLAVNAENEEANYLRGKIAVEQQDFKKAKVLFEKVLTLTKNADRKTEVQGYLKQLKGGK